MNRNCLRVALRDTTLSSGKIQSSAETWCYLAGMVIGAVGVVLLIAF